MADCPYCQISGRPNSKIYGDIRQRCLRNGRGVCAGCQKLTDIERKIDDARRALGRLFDEREELVTVINEHHDPFAHRLPVEITSRIFVHCRPVPPSVYTSGTRCNERELIRNVLDLVRVCKNWRRIAQGTPKLWTILCATMTRSNCISSVKIIQEWLQRSGGLPLFIQIGVEDYDDDKSVSHTAQRVVTSLMQHAQRWEVVELDLPPSFSPWMTTILSDKRLDKLEHIKSYIIHNDGEPLQLNAFPSRLTIRAGTLAQLSISCKRLTHVSLSTVCPQEARVLFQDSPHLLFCEILDCDDDSGPTATESPIVNLSLRTIKISCSFATFWDHFSFPSLEKIVHTTYSMNDWSPFEAFLLRSDCRLQELDVRGYHPTPLARGGLVDVLKLTSDLKRLSVQGSSFSEAFFSEMDAAALPRDTMEPAVNFLKNLVSIRCTTHQDSFDWSWLVSFLVFMTVRDEPSLGEFEFQYLGQHPAEFFSTVFDKNMFKHVMDVVQGLDVKILDSKGQDWVERLRLHHSL